MNTVLYYLNLTLLPLFFTVVLVKNVYNLTKQAFRWSVSETMNAYRSNRRVFKMD
jgi:hypothetical protein